MILKNCSWSKRLSGAPLVNSTNKWVDFALRKELRNAVASGSDYMTIGSRDMVRRMTGGARWTKEFYGKIVPKRLEQLIKKFDKDAKVEVVEIQKRFADKNIVESRSESKGQWKVLGVKLTDKLVNAMADKGMPIFQFCGRSGFRWRRRFSISSKSTRAAQVAY